MKIIKFLLLTISILSSTAWADCPPRGSIKIEDNHFVAYDQFGVKWISANPTYDHKLPVTEFWRAMGTKMGDVGAFAIHFSCAYTTSDGHPIGLIAPREQIYKLSESPYWGLRDGRYKTYICIHRNKESDCPFMPY